jgi:hypothetical protein
MTSHDKKRLPPSPFGEPDAFTNDMDFDSLEEKIRGDEFMQDEEFKKVKEEREVQKKIDEIEVDKRLEELKKKIKPNKKTR